MHRTSILLVEDHHLVREGFRGLIKLDPDLVVIGEAEDGRQAVALAKHLRPDVVLMDIAMPLLNGLEATRQIVAADPATRVIILTAHRDDAYIDSAITIGAAGFLLKQTTSTELYRAIREVVAGRHYIATALRSAPGGTSSQRMRVQPIATRLTPREIEVLQLIAEGKANKETARILGIGVKTVEKHREHLMAKLGMHDTAAITRYAISSGVIESSVQVTVI